MVATITAQRIHFLTTILFGGIIFSASAHGQEAGQTQSSAAASSSTDVQSEGDIVVTARKRQETLLNVPVVANVISPAVLERRATTDLKDIARLVPGLALSQTLGPSGIQVSLRGIGTSAQNAGIDASVALNVDGLQLTQGVAYSSAMFDLDHVEVLKGPQALFFGKNSPGGVISVRTADPKDHLELIASYGYEAVAQEHRAQLIISGPVSDTLKIRVAGQYDTLAGYFHNDAVAPSNYGGISPLDRNGPGGNSYIIRGTVLWEPSTNFDARLKANLSRERDTGGVGIQLVSCPDGTGPSGPLNIPFLLGETCRKDRQINLVYPDPKAFSGLLDNGDIFNEARQYYGSLEVNYRPGSDITLTSLTGYYHLLYQSQQSASTSTYAGPSLMSVVDPIRRHDFTEEVRIASDFSGPINFTGGGFLQRSGLFFHSSLPGNKVLGAPVMLSNFEDQVNIQTNSLFGQLRWKPISSIEISAGARWTDEGRQLTAWNLLSGSAVVVPTSRPNIRSRNLAPEFTIAYHPNINTTIFGSYKKGYKSGSFNFAPITTVLPDQSFGDEEIKGWEGGIKAQTPDRSLFASLAVYDYRYMGLQVGVSAPSTTNGPPINRTLNAGSAKIYGVDFDLNYVPRGIRGLSLQGSVEWNHARYTDLTGVPCFGGQTIAEGCDGTLNPVTGRYTTQTLSGLPLLRAPAWAANFGFNYERSVSDGLTIDLASTSQYSSDYLADLGLRPDFYQPGYFKTDLTVSLKGRNDRWVFDVIGKNLTDKLTSSGCVNSNVQGGVVFGGEVTGGTTRGPAGVDELACYMDRGREVWLRITLRPFN